jgi:acetyltransferase-like isoleucine patch superfamily enzyme
MIRRSYLRLLYRLRGIEAINHQLLRPGRVEWILREFGASLGPETVIHGPLVIHNADRDYANLEIRRLVHVGRLVILDLTDRVVLEDETVVSMGSTILTHSDLGERVLRERYPRQSSPTRIGPGAYLGANVTVLAGCDVGHGAVVGAGAVVTRQVPDHEVVAGVPARALSPRSGGATKAGTGDPQGIDIVDEV